MLVLASALLAAAALALLVPRDLDHPGRAFQSAVANALAANADDRLLEVALAQYPEHAPAIAITYGHLDLFREQLARFGPQVVPIVAAYQGSLTTADALQTAGRAWQSVRAQLGGEPRAACPAHPGGARADRSAQDARRGQCLRRSVGDHHSRRGPTGAQPNDHPGRAGAADRRAHRARARHRPGAGDRLADLRARGSRPGGDRLGVALLRFARIAARGTTATRLATTAPTLRSGALAAAQVLGVNAIRFGVPIGLVALMVLHPGAFTHYLWVLAEKSAFRDPRRSRRLEHRARAARVSAYLDAARANAPFRRLAVRRFGTWLPQSRGRGPGLNSTILGWMYGPVDRTLAPAFERKRKDRARLPCSDVVRAITPNAVGGALSPAPAPIIRPARSARPMDPPRRVDHRSITR